MILSPLENFYFKKKFNNKVIQSFITNNFVIKSLARILLVWPLQVVTIATKIPGEIEQIIVSFYLKHFYNQMISLEDMVSSSFAVLALNVL